MLVAGTVVVAFLIGGVAQAELWRLTRSPLAAMVNSQFCWAFVCFVIALLGARGSARAGIAWGAGTGFALIASYYLAQWVSAGAHAVSTQFRYAHGPAWVLGSVLAGGCFGLCGGLLSGARQGTSLAAIGGALAAFTIGVGPALSSASTGRMTDFLGHLTPQTWAAIGYGFVGIAILGVTWRVCGRRSTAIGAALGLGMAAVALGVLFLAERHGVLYQTF